ncbi:hypothetical protein L2E82_30528 [Cichorium intybus]|uniref:Uncharacterized protein n=1 Tax=Cichorium intybus TaxID=13427 RepID=A0ACB9D0J8_CICIN|nr:hypothetical protein L2E82_30528 [Cichorium intybus]
MSSISTPLIHNLLNRFDLHTDDRRHLLLLSPSRAHATTTDHMTICMPVDIRLQQPSPSPPSLPSSLPLTPPADTTSSDHRSRLSCRPPIPSILYTHPIFLSLLRS